MKDIFYLVVDRSGVRRMTKSSPPLRRGEIPVRIKITVEDSAFTAPVIERDLAITDWRPGRGAFDVAVKEQVITQADADRISADLLLEMQYALERQGFTVTPPGAAGGGA